MNERSSLTPSSFAEEPAAARLHYLVHPPASSHRVSHVSQLSQPGDIAPRLVTKVPIIDQARSPNMHKQTPPIPTPDFICTRQGVGSHTCYLGMPESCIRARSAQ